MFGWKNFYITMLATISILCIGSILINILVDPYDIWRDKRSIGFNFCAIRSENVERLMKPIRILEIEPETILLGNSKIDFAMNPIDNGYNFGLRNAQPFEILKIVETTHARKIILAIDFEMFIDRRELMPGFDENQLESNHMTLGNFFRSTLSLDSLRDSFVTVEKNHREQLDFPTIDRGGKYDDRFLAKLFEFENDFYATSRQLIIEVEKSDPKMFQKKIREFEKIVETCQSRGIDLQVLIPPVHSNHIEAYEFNRELYESWLKQIVAIHPVIDFVSLEGDFWNSTHMKTSIGDLIIDRLESGNFEIVNSENVEDHLKNLWKNLEHSNQMKFVGRFNSDLPIELDGDFLITPEIFSINWIESNQNILSIRGQIDLPRSEVIVSFVKLGRFYSRLTNLNLDGEIDSSYNFFTEAILSSDQSKISSAQIFCVTKSHGILASEEFWEVKK